MSRASDSKPATPVNLSFSCLVALIGIKGKQSFLTRPQRLPKQPIVPTTQCLLIAQGVLFSVPNLRCLQMLADDWSLSLQRSSSGHYPTLLLLLLLFSQRRAGWRWSQADRQLWALHPCFSSATASRGLELRAHRSLSDCPANSSCTSSTTSLAAQFRHGSSTFPPC